MFLTLPMHGALFKAFVFELDYPGQHRLFRKNFAKKYFNKSTCDYFIVS